MLSCFTSLSAFPCGTFSIAHVVPFLSPILRGKNDLFIWSGVFGVIDVGLLFLVGWASCRANQGSPICTDVFSA